MSKTENKQTEANEQNKNINQVEDFKQEEESKQTVVAEEKPVCGIIMPISPIDDCSAEHWIQVKSILFEAIKDAGYKPSLVSDADDSGIIQKRIVQNVYDNEIVVCDVSGKNPNVMFELGMRLAFDKPTIIVIDDKTSYSFDTGQIEHLQYPRDLNYHSIMGFKERLKDKIIATIKSSKDDPNYTTFLKHFGEFEVAHVEKKKGTIDEVVLSRLSDLSSAFSRLERRVSQRSEIPSSMENKDSVDERVIREVIQQEINNYCSLNNVDKDDLVLLGKAAAEKVIEKVEDYRFVRDYFLYRPRLVDYVENMIKDQ